MSDQPEKNEKEDEIPAFRFTPKKVDDSWKDEVRRERAAATGSQPPPQPAPPPPKQAPAAKAAEPPKDAKPADSKPQPSAAEQQQSKIFMTFLAGLAQQALMQLGAIESPFTGQREIDLNGARYTIEILNTLQAKTKNNLTEEESAALTEAIHDLKMHYIEIAQELQRQAQAQRASGPMRPGPGGAIPGPGFDRRK